MNKAVRRGRPLTVIIFLLGAWVLMRALQTGFDRALPDNGFNLYPPKLNLATMPEYISYNNPDSGADIHNDAVPPHSGFAKIIYPDVDSGSSRANIDRHLVSDLFQPSSTDAKKMVKKVQGAAFPHYPENHSVENRFGFYGYSYWRGGSRQNGLAAAGQYGGSQTGIIVDYRLTARANGPKLFARATTAPSQPNSKEVAIGLKVKPAVEIPLTVAVERRIAETASDVFAVYAAGGVGDVKLPLNFNLEAYGQAGLIRGKRRDRFFDAAVRVDRPLTHIAGLKLRCGFGGWSGGQRGSGRLDIGPLIQTNLPVGDKSVRLSADYRIRVLGGALPENGPAISLSTGF